ncbi:helix-turn-helix domain-containing protein [Derxia lacustris]|uniref:helix-turn-helix domain-containing protein n=1 Tax=Derxia lacustris TaxID=764842 RepID=UPI000A1759EB|nr:helix-turn-helix domain-containing protein [Derxia lacustris]
MRTKYVDTLPAELQLEAQQLGAALARLRQARRLRQEDAAMRSGLSRNTAYRLEKGDPGVAIGQVLRYLAAIAPGVSLLALLGETDPSLHLLASRERTERVRRLSGKELQDLDF